MKTQSSYKQPASITAALMAISVSVVMTACSPTPSAEETAAQTKAIVEQAVEETKKGILAEQAAEKARQEAAVATAKRELAAEQRAAAARASSRQSTTAAPSASNAPGSEKISCANCGVVMSVKVVETAGKGSGLGAVTGGVVGGLLGNQVGDGTGKDVATIVGVVGGAVAGNAIEKNAKKTTSYDITVKMDTGEERVVRQATAPNVVSGDAVIIENDVIIKK